MIPKYKKTNWQKQTQIFTIIIVLVLTLTSIDMAQTGQVQHVHDPCIIKCGDYYYIFSTGERIAMRRSKDLLSWQYIGEVFKDIPAWGRQEVSGVSNIWAPDIFYHNGAYYLYYSLSTFGSNRSRIGLATNKTLDPNDADYNWIDQGKVFESNTNYNYNAIDPNIAIDQEGQIWMSFGSFWTGIKLLQLDGTTCKPPITPCLYSIASRGGGAIEAPFIVYKNGYYYLFVSFDFCCRGVDSDYKIMVGRASKITGPYVDRNKKTMLNGGGHLLTAGDTRWRGTGHCAILMEEKADWLVYHAYDANANGTPTLRITRLYWDVDGWPTIDETASTMTVKNDEPSDFMLYQNYPNPFNASTCFEFDLEKASHTKFSICDVRGRELVTLINGPLTSGHHVVTFDGSLLSSGIYMYALQIESRRETRKMAVLN